MAKHWTVTISLTRDIVADTEDEAELIAVDRLRAEIAENAADLEIEIVPA